MQKQPEPSFPIPGQDPDFVKIVVKAILSASDKDLLSIDRAIQRAKQERDAQRSML